MTSVGVGDCETLVRLVLPTGCDHREVYWVKLEIEPRILVDAYPEFGVALWARCCEGDSTVINLMDRKLRRFLRGLAKGGILAQGVYEDALYQFKESKFYSNEIRRFSMRGVLTLV